jgi:catechol 2,3-dioxygenase-like lactoylglutathione lyase family enzyme
MTATLEHANMTVTDAKRTAAWMETLFGWHTRWEGPAIDGGHSLHVGTEDQYLALYQPAAAVAAKSSSYRTAGGLNHIAVVVEDLAEMEQQVKDLGFTPENHADYEPGRRFYFHDHDGIEFELVEYD